MNAPERFDVVIVPFPFIDLDLVKRRPALVLSNAVFNSATETLACLMITSANDSEWHDDQLVEDWITAGLRSPCKIRMKFFSIELDMASAPVGRLGAADRERTNAAVARLFA